MMVWDQGWFGIKDGLIDTPKTFHEFLEKVLNVLLTNGLGFGIMQKAACHKMDPKSTDQDLSCDYLTRNLLLCLATGLSFPNPHLELQVRQVANQMFLQQMTLPNLLT